MNKMYLLEKQVQSKVKEKRLFETRNKLFAYLVEHEETIFNCGFERYQLIITEVEIERRETIDE